MKKLLLGLLVTCLMLLMSSCSAPNQEVRESQVEFIDNNLSLNTEFNYKEIEKKLAETFLQRDYKGEWIDGVVFTHNGKKVDSYHVESLGEINYR